MEHELGKQLDRIEEMLNLILVKLYPQEDVKDGKPTK